MSQKKFFEMKVKAPFVKPEIMFIKGKAVKSVIPMKSVVLIDGVEHSPSELIDVKVPLFEATRVDL